MSSGANAKGVDRAKIFETVLSSPGMQDVCKVGVSSSRQTILLLCRLIESGLERKEANGGEEMFFILADQSLSEIRIIVEELLKKTDLTQFYQRLKEI